MRKINKTGRSKTLTSKYGYIFCTYILPSALRDYVLSHIIWNILSELSNHYTLQNRLHRKLFSSAAYRAYRKQLIRIMLKRVSANGLMRIQRNYEKTSVSYLS